MELTSKQFSILLDLYHELNDVFRALPREVRDAFFDYLHAVK